MASIDISMATVVAGAVMVGVNAVVVNFTNWMTARALKKLEMEKGNKNGSKGCECRGCPMFEKCKERH